MNDIVIRAENLKKVYRLYTRPSYRFRDMFGLLGDKPGAYTEHAALDGVNLEIRRGEKVAIIGRNGAGKSTFLKLVTSVITPTSGRLDVTGRVQALLQLGTGFHPDFTGRENVYAYLAQLGITGEEARRKCDETIEFAEIEEYIDQPMKTYSTGMGVRLMFAASTVITPDLLVLDEVLGVGDAYFTHKSYGRIQEMCDRDGTTLLLVTHDIYSATRICNRVVWIDRGRIVMDDTAPAVVQAYEDSIRRQEENRLRLKKQAQLKALAAGASGESHIIVEVQSRNNEAQKAPLYISQIVLDIGGRKSASVSPGELTTAQGDAQLQFEGTAWGDPEEIQGRHARPLRNYGTPFHKAAAAFRAHYDKATPIAVRLDYWSEAEGQFVVRAFCGPDVYDCGDLHVSPGGWETFQGAGVLRNSGGSEISVSGRQGTGEIDVLDVRAIGARGDEAHLFEHGAPCTLLIDYRINNPSLRERAQVLVAFHRDGVHDVSRVITRDLPFDYQADRVGTIRLHLPKLLLGTGNYTVSVLVGTAGYYDSQQVLFYSINPGVYAAVPRIVDMTVVGGGLLASGTGVVLEGEWSLVSGEPAHARLRQ